METTSTETAVEQMPAGVAPPPRTPTDAEVQAQAETRKVNLAETVQSITQREWLVIIKALDCSKEDVMEEMAYMLPACAWVAEKRRHGGADWERILDLTDTDLVKLLGIDVNDGDTVEVNLGVGETDPTSPSGGPSAPTSA